MGTVKHDEIRQTVRQQYGQVAKSNSAGCGCDTTCCGTPTTSAEALGYSADDVGIVPEGANMGLGCGNPQAIAALKPGEVVLDLGSGGGFDCFLAARQVGDAGHVIGVDMTPEMIAKARANAHKSRLPKCRVPPWRNREFAGGGWHGGCHHLELCHQPFAR